MRSRKLFDLSPSRARFINHTSGKLLAGLVLGGLVCVSAKLITPYGFLAALGCAMVAAFFCVLSGMQTMSALWRRGGQGFLNAMLITGFAGFFLLAGISMMLVALMTKPRLDMTTSAALVDIFVPAHEMSSATANTLPAPERNGEPLWFTGGIGDAALHIMHVEDNEGWVLLSRREDGNGRQIFLYQIETPFIHMPYRLTIQLTALHEKTRIDTRLEAMIKMHDFGLTLFMQDRVHALLTQQISQKIP
jgi:hypothetical protein